MPLRLSLVALGLALIVYGTASLTGGWLGVPSHTPVVVSYGLDSLAGIRARDQSDGAVSTPGWQPPWYARTESRFVDIDAILTAGRPPRGPLVYVTTTTRPRPGREWISGAVIAVGLALAAWGAWSRRRRTLRTAAA